jgi:hypothetical protein
MELKRDHARCDDPRLPSFPRERLKKRARMWPDTLARIELPEPPKKLMLIVVHFGTHRALHSLAIATLVGGEV